MARLKSLAANYDVNIAIPEVKQKGATVVIWLPLSIETQANPGSDFIAIKASHRDASGIKL